MATLTPEIVVAPPGGRTARHRLALFALCAAQFLVVLDIAIVNVALPSIATSLQMSGTALAWVVNAYVLALAGLLLVGGRLADQFGRRRLFTVGLVSFGFTSLVCGSAIGADMLLAARAVQ